MKKLLWVGCVLACLPVLAGCGKVAQNPISPLVSPPVQYSFDGSIQGWFLDSSNPSMISAPVSLSDENQVVFQGTGALEISTPVSLTGVNLGVDLPQTMDMTGKVLSVWIYWQSGVVSSPYQIGAQIFMKDTSYNWSSAGWTTLSQGHWTQVVCYANSATGSTPANLQSISEVGFQVAGSNNAVFTSPGVVYADSFGF